MMNNNTFLPEKSKKREYRFRPWRTAAICVLIAAILVSMSVGLSYAKFVQQDGVSPTFKTAGVLFDESKYIYQERIPGQDTVFTTFGGKVKITVPATAEGANLTNADYLALRVDKEEYTVDYTKNKGQYAYNCKYYLFSYQYSDDKSFGLTAKNVHDDNNSITVELQVGKEYSPSLELTAYTKPYPETKNSLRRVYPEAVPHRYDAENGTIVFYNISELKNTYYQEFRFVYDKKSWDADMLNDEHINLDYSGSTVRISSAKDLTDAACLVNWGIEDFEGKTLVLDNDISLYSDDLRLDIADNTSIYEKRPWTPIGTYEHPFRGSFEGNNHTISGVNIRDFGADTSSKYNSAGLFGCVYADDNIAISDFAMNDIHISCNLGDEGESGSIGPTVGAVVGTDYREGSINTNQLTIDNIVVTDITFTNESKYTGGIMGHGLCGRITNCSVTGLDMNTAKSYQVGGIIGLQHGRQEPVNGEYPYADEINISGCTVSGKIRGGYDTAGGIIAQATGGAVGVKDCVFNGGFEASTYTDDYYTGGIVAQLAQTEYPSGSHPVYHITNCESYDYSQFGNHYHDNITAEVDIEDFPIVD